MRVEVGAPAIVAVIPGIGDTGLWHLPKLTLPVWNGPVGYESLAYRLEHGHTPPEWPTLCDLGGGLYAYNGVLRRRRLCSVCRERHRGGDWAHPLHGPLPPGEIVNRQEVFWRRCKITPAHARALHVVYQRDGVGVTRLADLYFERLGYRTSATCASALRNAFLMLGLPLRDHAEAQRARAEAQRQLGFGGRTYVRRLTVETVDRLWRLYEAGYSSHEISRRFFKRLGFPSWERLRNGLEYAWRTQGRRLRSPREAELLSRRRHRGCQATVDKRDGSRPFPCPRHALVDSGYCWSHDPRHREQVERNVAAMQAKIQREPTVAWALVRPHLGPLLVPRPDPRGRARVYETAAGALARNTGVNPAICSRLLLGRQERISVRRADELLAPLGLTVEDFVEEAIAA